MAGFIPNETAHITVAVASAQSAVTFQKGDRLSLISTTNCWILTGTNPTAAANTGVYVPAGVPMTVYITADLFKVAAIRATADGDLTISKAVGE